MQIRSRKSNELLKPMLYNVHILMNYVSQLNGEISYNSWSNQIGTHISLLCLQRFFIAVPEVLQDGQGRKDAAYKAQTAQHFEGVQKGMKTSECL